MRVFKRFWRDRRGQFAVITGLLVVPMLAAVGLTVDYSRYTSAQNRLQVLADLASLTLASSQPQNNEKSKLAATNIVTANDDDPWLQDIAVTNVDATNDYVRVYLAAAVEPTFMSFFSHHKFPLSAQAKAERALNGSVELSLILDNTWSMSETDDKGVSKIAALKTAAANLVNEVLNAEDGSMRIAIVPYADYVNVGTKYRYKSWLSIPVDYVVPATPAVCVTKTTQDVCIQTAAKYACTTVTDGVVSPSTCGGNCTKYETRSVAPYQSCSGGSAAKSYT